MTSPPGHEHDAERGLDARHGSEPHCAESRRHDEPGSDRRRESDQHRSQHGGHQRLPVSECREGNSPDHHPRRVGQQTSDGRQRLWRRRRAETLQHLVAECREWSHPIAVADSEADERTRGGCGRNQPRPNARPES